MSKYDKDVQDVYAVKQLGDSIGYGHLMALAHELWARHLESKGLPRTGAHCAVGYPMVKEQYQAEALNDRIYTIVVGKALADRKTESSSENPNNSKELNAYRECVKSRSFWDSKHCDGCYFYERCPFDEPMDEPQKKEVKWVYNKRERLWYPYSNGELLFNDKPTTQTETQNSNLIFEKQPDCKTCKYGQDKHRYAHICNECGVGINNYTPQTERSE